MIELYALLCLLGVGYIITKQNQIAASDVDMMMHHGAVGPRGGGGGGHYSHPARRDCVFYNTAVRDAQRTEQELANRLQRQSMMPGTRVVNNFYREQQSDLNRLAVRNLAGEFVPVEAFLGENVQPFFGGSVKQVGVENEALSAAKLENFTGGGNRNGNKREVEFFGDKDAPANIHGMPMFTEERYSRGRIVPPVVKRNDLPFKQELVGVGKYDIDINVRDRIVPKSVDELRAANRPKLSATEGRTMPGSISIARGELGETVVCRPEAPERTQEQLLVTTGANLKPAMVDPESIVMRNTTRGTDDHERPGGGGGAYTAASAGSAPYAAYGHNNQQGTGLRARRDEGARADGHGGYVGNVLKAITAPVMDVMSFTLKDVMAVSKRLAFVQPQGPAASSAQPSDAPRTTNKQTLLHSTEGTGSLHGHKMTTVYSDQVARTTIKETLEFSSADHGGAITAPQKCVAVYDPQSVALLVKTTVRETTTDAAANEWVRNVSSTTSNDVFSSSRPSASSIPSTMRDIDAERAADQLFGVDGVERQAGGYLSANVEAPPTVKHELVVSAGDQIPAAFGGKDGAYLVTETHAKATDGRLNTHVERFGGSSAAAHQQEQTDRTVMDMERTNCSREHLVESRDPVDQKAKVFSADVGAVKLRDTKGGAAQQAAGSEPVQQQVHNAMFTVQPSQMSQLGETTRHPNMSTTESHRLEPQVILAPLKDNPFVVNMLSTGGGLTE